METPASDNNHKIALPTLGGFEMIDYTHIIYCKGESSQSSIYSDAEKKHIVVCLTLKQLEKRLLPRNYFRIHKSYLINIDHIKHYNRGRDGKVLMDNNETLPVSRTHKKAFEGRFRGMWE